MGLKLTILTVLILVCAGIASAADDAPLVAQSPTLSKAQVVFAYGGYLWSVPREGGEARQLTTRGCINFNRYYSAQVGRQGAVFDERPNHGGEVPDYIIDMLKRPLRNCTISREGETFCSPLAQMYGPKTMLINEMAGSGGDAWPWMFRQDKVGPLVGKRTWGGLVEIYNYPPLLDGGLVTAPRFGIFGLHGEWEVENQGIPPDIEVENDPASVAAGHDLQLEKAVEVTLAALKKNPVVIPDHPPYPNYHKK
jgi:tricorn protease